MQKIIIMQINFICSLYIRWRNFTEFYVLISLATVLHFTSIKTSFSLRFISIFYHLKLLASVSTSIVRLLNRNVLLDSAFISIFGIACRSWFTFRSSSASYDSWRWWKALIFRLRECNVLYLIVDIFLYLR